MPSLVDPEDPLDPRHHLVTAGVGRLVQADEPRLDVLLDVPLERRGPMGQRGVVVRPHVQFVEVLEEQRPLRGVQLGGWLLRGGH